MQNSLTFDHQKEVSFHKGKSYTMHGMTEQLIFKLSNFMQATTTHYGHFWQFLTKIWSVLAIFGQKFQLVFLFSILLQTMKLDETRYFKHRIFYTDVALITIALLQRQTLSIILTFTLFRKVCLHLSVFEGLSSR